MGEWGRERTAGAPACKAPQLIPPAGRLDRGGLPQDGAAPRDRPSLDSAVAHIGAKTALAGAPTHAQGDATPKASCTASAHSGGVASHRCKAKGLGESGQPCWERARGFRNSVRGGDTIRQWSHGNGWRGQGSKLILWGPLELVSRG